MIRFSAHQLSHWLRSWRRRIVGACLLLLIFLAVIWLAAPASPVSFQLHATTSLVTFACATPVHVDIAAREWSAAATDPSAPVAVLRSSQPPGAPGVTGPDRLGIAIRAGDTLTLRRLPGEPARFGLTLSRPAELLVTRARDSLAMPRLNNETEARMTAPEATMRIGGNTDIALRLRPASNSDAIFSRFTVSHIGFSAVSPRGIETGLIDGGLQFFDNPEKELKLNRGNDLRLGEMDAAIDAVVLSNDGIALTAVGTASHARLFRLNQQQQSEWRTISPSRYDALKIDPVTAVAATAITALLGVIGCIFTVAGAIPAGQRWLAGLFRSRP